MDNERSASPFILGKSLNYSYIDQRSPNRINSLSKRHFSNPGLPLTSRQSPTGGLSRATSVLAIQLDSEKDAKVILPPEIIPCNLKAFSSGKKDDFSQEKQEW